jgi:hypothetical protein
VTVGWDPNPESQVIGYKVHYGTAPGAYTQVIDVGPVTEARIPNMVDRLVYYCTVSAYGSNGVQSSYSQELAVVSSTAPSGEAANTARLVLLEAESGSLTAPMEKRTAGSDSWVETSGTSASGAVSLAFNAAVAGDYTVWCRVIAPGLGDSYAVSLDGGGEQTFQPNSAGTTAPSWTWRRMRLGSGATSFPLSIGSHTLRMRSATTGLKLDRIVLSSNPNFVPDDSLPRSGDVIKVVGASSVQGSTSGSPVVLQVDAVASGALSYQWMKDGALIAGATGPSLSLPATSAAELARYSVNLWTGSTVYSSRAAALTIRQDPLLVKRLTRGTNQTVTFDVTGLSGTGVNVYASANMVDWVLLTNPSVTTSTVTVTDSLAIASKRFYRLEAP